MSKYIFFILFICYSIVSPAQVKTKITGFIPDLNHLNAKVELSLFYPLIIGQGRKVNYKTETNNGYFEYIIELEEPLTISGAINEKPLFFPGTFGVLINPGDSIHIDIPNLNKLGILNLSFSGKGSEKVDFQKAVVKEKLKLYKLDPEYASQNLDYKFFSADRKLNSIDSICNNGNSKINKNEINLIKALEYESVLDMLLYSAKNNKSDSLKILFERYIVKKNRIKPFLIGANLHHTGITVLHDFVLLSEFDKPVAFKNLRRDDPLKYFNLIIKHLSKYPIAKEYLLSDVAIGVFAREQDSENTQLIYQLYSDNVRHNSPFFNKVMNNYQIIISRLKKGMPFYSFSLPDTLGNMHKLSDFNGKVVILDFWFNGCGGCKVMAPVIEDLENIYKGKDVQFISVSIDSNEKWWLSGIGKYCSKSSLQLYTEGRETKHPLVSFLNPRGYPFLVAIDKNGNLIGPPPDPRVSKTEFKRFVDQYL